MRIQIIDIPNHLQASLKERHVLVDSDPDLVLVGPAAIASTPRSPHPTLAIVDSTDSDQIKSVLKQGYNDFLLDTTTPAELLTRIELVAQRNQIRESLESQVRELQSTAETDPLTGALNRRGLAAQTTIVLQHTPLSALALDLDHFKQLNDTLGHKAGDAILVGLVKLCRQRLRTADLIIRTGGDEFVILLPNTDADGASRVAGKLLDVFNQYTIRQELTGVGLSVGVAELGDGESIEQLLDRADTALYQAKAAGRGGIARQTE